MHDGRVERCVVYLQPRFSIDMHCFVLAGRPEQWQLYAVAVLYLKAMGLTCCVDSCSGSALPFAS